jgi:oligopeptide transport system permease protein
MLKRSLGILVGIAVITAACGSAIPNSSLPGATEPGSSPAATTATTSNLAAEQVLRVGSMEPATLDPTLAADGPSVGVLRALHRPLVYLDDHSEVVPALARSWDIAADARTLTFHLRDAKYSNGDPIVAGDVVYSWRRLADPRTAAPYSFVMADVVGGPELLAMAGVDPAPADADIEAALDKLGLEAPDDHTFIVHLVAPATYFLSAMTLWVFGPYQEAWITGVHPTEPANYVSSGPFVLDRWEHGSEIVLKPNPYWWGDVKPTLTEIQMSMRSEPAQAQAAYEAGEIDMVATPNEDVRRVRDDPVLGAEYGERTRLAINFYTFNNFQDPKVASYANPGPTANRDFRIALIQAIDKQAFIDATLAGLGEAANSYVMPGIPGYQPDLNPYPYDPESADRHMDKALAELGVGSAAELGALRFGFISGAGFEPQIAFLAEAWRQAFGLETEQIASDFGVFAGQRQAGEYAISWDAWGADYPHANNQLNGLFTCGGGNNNSQYCNPAFDALIAKAAAEPDQGKQADIYKEAQKIMMDDANFLPLLFRTFATVVKPWVDGEIVTSIDHNNPGDNFAETIRIIKTSPFDGDYRGAGPRAGPLCTFPGLYREATTVISYITRRVLWIIPVLFTVSILTFGLMHAVPGGPWDAEKRLPAGVEANLNAQYGLDKPVYEQYVQWAAGFVQGDLGPSYRSRDRRVNDIVADGLPTTVQLGIQAFILAVLVGIPLGIFAALGHNRWPDYLSTSISIIGISTPSFVLAILLIVLFSITLDFFPTGGWKGPSYWILPTVALAGFPIAVIARYTRASMLEVTRKDYIRTAQSKGLRERAVVTRHMIRNALIPVVTILGPTLAFLVTGSFIIETIFSVPGIGRFYISAISTRDYSLLMAMTMLYAAAIAFLNLIVDVLYAYIDPRIRYS